MRLRLWLFPVAEHARHHDERPGAPPRRRQRDRRERTAQVTLDIYAPIANRLGIWRIKSELEDLSFRFLNPASYKEIKSAVQQKEADREKFVRRIRSEFLKMQAHYAFEVVNANRGEAALDRDLRTRVERILTRTQA